MELFQYKHPVHGWRSSQALIEKSAGINVVPMIVCTPCTRLHMHDLFGQFGLIIYLNSFKNHYITV